MPSVRELLERESTTVDLERGDFERLLRRRDRKRRNQRIGAGVVAAIVVLLTAAILLRSFDQAAVPANPPEPPVGVLGALAYSLGGDVYVADRNGANPVRIADGQTGDCARDRYWAEGTMWSPDGRYLAFRHETCQDGRTGWRGVVISDPKGNVVASFPGEGWLISWSPDSTRVAVWATWGKTIGVYGLDGEQQELLSLPSGLMTTGDNDPVWSRDGTSLLVPNGIEIPLDGAPPRQLPRRDPRSLGATYSPDGSRVAYRDDVGSLVIAMADGSDARVAGSASGGWVDDPFWSPSGDRIAFTYSGSANDPSNEIRVVDLATRKVTSLIGLGGTEHLSIVEFSPDGDRILFRRTADGGRGVSSLWSIDADGSDPLLLVTGTVSGDWPWGDWR